MLDPKLNGLQLQQLAAENPDLWPDILAHPNCYPALAQWIQSSLAAQSQPAQPTQPVQQKPVQPQPHPAQPTQPVRPAQSAQPQTQGIRQTGAPASKPQKSRGLVIAVSVLAALVVIALVGVGILYIPGWFNKGCAATDPNSAIERFAKQPKYIATDLPSGMGKVMSIIPDGQSSTILGKDTIYKWDGKEFKKDEAKINESAPVGYVRGVPANIGTPAISGGDKYPWFKAADSGANGNQDSGEQSTPDSNTDSQGQDKPQVITTGPDGKDKDGREYGGGDGRHLCSFSSNEAVCGSPEELDNGTAEPVGDADKSSTSGIDMKIVGALALDDGNAVIKKSVSDIFNETEIELQGKDGKTEKVSINPGVFGNAYEYVGYASDWQTRMVPTPTTGLTVSKLYELLTSKAGQIKIVDGVVLNQTGYASQDWSDGKVTFVGMLEPIQVSDKYLLATYGQPATAENPEPTPEGTVVFDRDGKEISRHAFAVPSRVFADGGRVFTVPLDESQPPKLYEYGVEEGEQMPAGQAPQVNQDKEAIKKIDFGNFKSKALAADGKEPMWNYSGGKFEIEREGMDPVVSHVFQSDVFYQDIDGDGFLDAIVPSAYCLAPGHCSALAYIFLWDNGSNEPIVFSVLGNVRTKYETGSINSTRSAAIDLIKKKDGKAAFCMAALDNLDGDCHTFKVFKRRGMYFDQSNTAVYTWDPDEYQTVNSVPVDSYTLKALPYDDAPDPTVKFSLLFETSYAREENGYVELMGIKEGTSCGDDAEKIGLRCGYKVWGKKK